MTYFRFLIIFFLIFTLPLNANDLKIIELHKNKSLDQLVLEKKNNDTDVQNIENNTENILSSDLNDATQELSEINENLSTTDSTTINDNEVVTLVNSETIFDLDEIIFTKHFETINNIKSKTLHREFIKILSNPDLENLNEIIDKLHYIIRKLYELGEIGKAYNLIKKIDINEVSKKESLELFYFIELNYLYSTFKLSEVCELKSLLIEESINFPMYLLEKSDIFCLTLENKFAEAKLLNSLLLDSEKQTDQNFQKLFNYMILNETDKNNFEKFSEIKSKELIFLYSAMLRINELALDEDFIEVDPLNLSIPVILSESTNMDIRIKAANKAFIDEVLSINSLSALYQSVDFNSKQLNNPKETITFLQDNNELIMAFYYQLVNVQIFPDERLDVILEYWDFAKKFGLEKIAYAITNNIIETFTPTTQNTKFGLDIAFAHISNKNYNEASLWIDLYENSTLKNDKLEYARFLIDLNASDELNTIKNYLSINYSNLANSNTQNTIESVEVLLDFLDILETNRTNFSYIKISDERTMPSYFLIKDINKHINNQKDLSIFLLSLISMNNKNWNDLHPEHLKLILNAFNLYENKILIKPIILEILNELEIF